MLKSFRIQNYKSILDETISLEYREGKAPNGYRDMPLKPFLTDSCGNKRAPVLVLLGANASGKSNLLSAVRCFGTILRSGIKKRFFPNKLNDKFKSTVFEISFSYEGVMYTYAVEYDDQCILREELKSDKQYLLKISHGKLETFPFTQKGYDFEEMERVLRVECTEDKLQIKCFLYHVCLKFPGLDEKLSGIYKILRKSINAFDRNFVPPTLAIDTTPKEEEERKNFLARMSQIIRQFDIDVEGFSVSQYIEEDLPFPRERVNLFNKNQKTAFVRHFPSPQGIKREVSYIEAIVKDIHGKEVRFDFGEDLSQGTRCLFGLIGVVLRILDNGETLFVDELDETLHPLIVQKILEMFKDPDYNKTGNAQLVCTVLNPLAVEGLRLSEVGFVQKTLEEGTKIMPLASFKGVRNTSDIVKRYMEGRFSAVPSPYL